MTGGLLRRLRIPCLYAGLVSALVGCGPRSDSPNPRAAGRDSTPDVVILGHEGRQPGQFSKPRAIEVTKDDELVVVDRTGRIQVYDIEGRFLRQWRLPADENGTPTGICLDPTDQSIWLADTHYQRILNYDLQGNLLAMWGERGEGPGQMIFPTDVAVDPDGSTLWVTEYGRGNRVLNFRRDGTFIRQWGTEAYDNTEMQRPMAVVLSPDAQSLFIVDAGNHRVNVYDRDGGLKFRFGEPGNEPGRMKFPLDMTLGPDGLLYLLQYEGARVDRYTLEGKWLDSWGTAGKGRGEFFLPWGVAVAPGGEVVVADTNNQRLQLLRNPNRHFARPATSAGGEQRQARVGLGSE